MFLRLAVLFAAMSFVPRLSCLLFAIVFLSSMIFPAIVIVNSVDYRDVLAGAVYASANGDTYVFATDPSQAVFISHYYTLSKTIPIIYLEGERSVLANMAALLRESDVQNLTLVQNRSIPDWVADQFPKEQAIVVGSQYGQDALSVAPYAALTRSPIFFVDEPGSAGPLMNELSSRGYLNVLLYGPIAHQLPPESTAKLHNPWTIDTGSRYTNNLQIAQEFLKLAPSSQVMFLSGHTFEKSMIDRRYPIILVGSSDVPAELLDFLDKTGVRTGVVFSSDAGIVDGVSRIRILRPSLSIFIKFGEGFRVVNQTQPLMTMPLPSPQIAGMLDILNVSYNIPQKVFELQVRNRGDPVSLTAEASNSETGSATSSQISIASGTTTTLSIPLDATRAISSGIIPNVSITVRYGEDTRLLDNIETILYSDVPLSYYSDNTSVSLTGITYSDARKAFIVQLEGDGWVDGSVRFIINERPISLPFSARVHGSTSVEIKYLLTPDEQQFINGLPADYFMRMGSRPDILLRESRGQSGVVLVAPPGAGAARGGLPSIDLPWSTLCGGLVLLIAIVLVFRFVVPRRGSFD